ncbi:MAG: flagellar regulator YcgR PilZN domain-containing protein [Burkholderiales bacterium]
MTQQTMPMPLDALGAAPGGLDEFRITTPREIGAMLKVLVDGNVQLNLNASDGSVVSATLWSADATRGSIGFNVNPDDPALHALVECQEAVIVGYLDSVKLQFDASDLVLVRGNRTCVLNCGWPREMFRFQRRGAFRVRPLLRSAPTARFRHAHAGAAEREYALRVLDVSIGGCALFLPEEEAPISPGSTLARVQMDLDADTRFDVDLRLHHLTSINADARGMRLGCEFQRPDGTVQRTLQRFIDLTQKRGKLLALS